MRLKKIWAEGPEYAIGEWNNVLLTAWRGVITAAALEVTRVASHDLHARFTDGLVVFNVIKHGIPIPNAETRNKASAVLGETGGHVLCTVTIIEGEGFWASAARAVLAGITLVSRAPHPHKVFATIEAGARWAAPNLRGPGATVTNLCSAADDVAARGLPPE